jgi:hypothetical protein
MRKSAADLIAELEADPRWVAARDERQRALAERAATQAAAEAPLVAELRRAGLPVDSVYDLVNNAPHAVLSRRFIGAYQVAYPILVRHLALPYPIRIREGIIRALTVRDGGPAVEEALLAAFEAERDPALRWVLANALRIAMPYRRRRRHPEIAAVYKERA